MTEADEALALASRILDRPNADPDDDLAVLARNLIVWREAGSEMARRLGRTQSERNQLFGMIVISHQTEIDPMGDKYDRTYAESIEAAMELMTATLLPSDSILDRELAAALTAHDERCNARPSADPTA